METGTSTLLEIRTLGSRGLRYRHRLGRGVSKWMHLEAMGAPRISDTCGSGDWCTAGLLAILAGNGQAGLRSAGAKDISEALRYGQALAAWNCAFEGARGGMYRVDRTAFDEQINALMKGQLRALVAEVTSPVGSAVACPACPPDRSLTEAHGKRRRGRRAEVADSCLIA
jgi:hypothetical protein